MTLEDYSYLADIIGVVLVIASLIYVARQLNQTVEMLRINASHERLQRDTELSSAISGSQEFAELWAKGGSDFTKLSDIEQLRLVFFERSAIAHWHNMFALRRRNLVSDADWNEMVWIIRNLGARREAVLQAWNVHKAAFSEPFQTFLDENLAGANTPSSAPAG